MSIDRPIANYLRCRQCVYSSAQSYVAVEPPPDNLPTFLSTDVLRDPKKRYSVTRRPTRKVHSGCHICSCSFSEQLHCTCHIARYPTKKNWKFALSLFDFQSSWRSSLLLSSWNNVNWKADFSQWLKRSTTIDYFIHRSVNSFERTIRIYVPCETSNEQ